MLSGSLRHESTMFQKGWAQQLVKFFVARCNGAGPVAKKPASRSKPIKVQT